MKILMIIAIALMLSGWEETRPPPRPQPTHPTYSSAIVNQEQTQSASASAGATATSSATNANDQNMTINDHSSVGVSTSFEGGDVNNNTTYEASAPNIVMVPNNNTESCLRVFGIMFSNQQGGGGLGIPWRSKKCDYEQAADDAFAQGEQKLGWYWKCQNPNLYKRHGSSESCLKTMMSLLAPVSPPAAPVDDPLASPQVVVVCPPGGHPEAHARIFKGCVSK